MSAPPQVGTKVSLAFPEAHPLFGMTGEVTRRYRTTNNVWVTVVRIDRRKGDYKRGDEVQAAPDQVKVL